MVADYKFNPALFPLVVVIESADMDDEIKHIKSVLTGGGTREVSELKSVIPPSHGKVFEVLEYYRSNPGIYKTRYMFVEFASEQEAFETVVAASFVDGFLFAIRFMDADRNQIDKIGDALTRFDDARRNFILFEEDIGYYLYDASGAGILNSNFSGRDLDSSEIKQLLKAEQLLIETHINAVLDSIRVKTG